MPDLTNKHIINEVIKRKLLGILKDPSSKNDNVL